MTWHSIGGLSNLPKLIAELLQQPPLKPLVLVVDGIDDIEYMSSEAADGKPRAFSPSEAALSWVPHSFHQKVPPPPKLFAWWGWASSSEVCYSKASLPRMVRAVVKKKTGFEHQPCLEDGRAVR